MFHSSRVSIDFKSNLHGLLATRCVPSFSINHAFFPSSSSQEQTKGVEGVGVGRGGGEISAFAIVLMHISDRNCNLNIPSQPVYQTADITTGLTRIALRWTPDGQRKRGRPKETWRRTVEREMKEKGWTWGRLERVSADRHRWRALVEALCAT